MEEDRISNLPTLVIHNLMSYLSAKEIIQISRLSKRWNLLRKSFSILDFDQHAFVEPYKYGKKKERKLLRKFITFVDDSLLQLCQLDFRLQKFRLSINLRNTKIPYSLLDKWIGLAVENEVKELDLVINPELGPDYSMPQTIFGAKSLATLTLVGCNLEQPSDSMMLYSLKKLTLADVCINEEIVQRLTRECPLLEDLAFIGCRGLKGLSVFEAPKLKIMTVEFPYKDMNFKSLEIAVPSLQQLTLRNAQVFDITGCLHLKKLELLRIDLTDQDFHYCISKFLFLEDLSVKECDFLERIKISSNRLKNLEVFSCKTLKAIDVDTPNLLSFIYDNDQSPTYSINAPCPWKICFKPEDDIDTRWYLYMKEFLGLSKQIKDLTLYVMSDKISFELDKFEEKSDSLPWQVGNLILHINTISSNYEALLNGLLRICYPKTLSVIMQSEIEMEFCEWMYEELESIRDVHCCNSRRVKCWRHHIKDLKISFIEGPWFVPDHVWDNLLPGGTLQVNIDWCFPFENT